MNVERAAWGNRLRKSLSAARFARFGKDAAVAQNDPRANDVPFRHEHLQDALRRLGIAIGDRVVRTRGGDLRDGPHVLPEIALEKTKLNHERREGCAREGRGAGEQDREAQLARDGRIAQALRAHRRRPPVFSRDAAAREGRCRRARVDISR